MRAIWMDRATAIVVAAVAIIVAFASIRAVWYHDLRISTYPTLNQEYRDENQYSLDGLYIIRWGDKDFWSYEEGSNFWEPMEPIHSFTEGLQILLTVGAILAGLWALLLFFGRRTLSNVAGVSSFALFASSALMFYLWFGSVYSATELPGHHPDFTEFFVSTTDDQSSFVVQTEIWGPMAGWWLAIAASATMAAGVAALDVLHRMKSRKALGTRPSRYLSERP